MVSLYRDPKGAKIFEGTESQTQNYSIPTTISTTHDPKSAWSYITVTVDVESRLWTPAIVTIASLGKTF